MPNLNFKNDPKRNIRNQPLSPFKRPPISGGGSKMLPLMVFFGFVVFVGVIVYVLNQSGYINLWGEKAKSIAVIKTETERPEITEPQTVVEEKHPVETIPVEGNDTSAKVEKEQKQAEMKVVEAKPAPEVRNDITKTKQKTSKTEQGSFVIFIGSFRVKKNAEVEAQKWSDAGYDVSITEKSFAQGNGKWYRVSIGNYPTREEAVAVAKKIGDSFEGGYWIDKKNN